MVNKVSTNFIIEEFVTPQLFKTIMKTNNPIEEFYKYVDKSIVDIVQFIRTKTNKVVVINNWHKGGTFTLRGFRPKNTKIGAKLSTHKTGKAVDFDIVGMTDKEVKEFVIKHQKELYALGARRMESEDFADTWCHLDLKPVKGYENKIYTFNP